MKRSLIVLTLIMSLSFIAINGLEKPETPDVNYETLKIEKTINEIQNKRGWFNKLTHAGKSLDKLNAQLKKATKKLNNPSLTQEQRNALNKEIEGITQKIAEITHSR